VNFNRFDNLTCSGNPTSVEAKALLADGTAESSDFVVTGNLSYQGQYLGGNYPARTGACEPLTVPVGGCPDANPRLGGGTPSDCLILQTHAFKVDITGPAGQLQGDICIAPNGKLSMSGDNFVTGDVRLDQGATCSGCSKARVLGSVITPPDPKADLTAEIAACDLAGQQNAPATATNPNGTLTCGPLSPASGKLTGTQTITGASGLNVICVNDVNVGNGQLITLDGPANKSAEFVFVVSGIFKIQGKIKVSPNVLIKNVLYNVIGTGADVSFTGGGGGVGCCKAEIDGSLIAIDRKIALSPGLINGQVCGNRDQAYVSGSSVRCPIP
jgi:hypothetical protein